MRNLKAEDVKAHFDWIEDNFRGSIKAHSSFSAYWRVLKRLQYQETGKVMDESMRVDCLNVSTRCLTPFCTINDPRLTIGCDSIRMLLARE